MNPELILVDDDSILLIVLEKMIRKVDPDIKLSMFSSGKEVLDYLSNFPKPVIPRFLLVDINLKDMSGWELLNELETRKDSYSKVILITSSVSSLNSETAKKYVSVIGFFEKPITFENIHQIFDLIKKD